jgi:CspA family cold shock protein
VSLELPATPRVVNPLSSRRVLRAVRFEKSVEVTVTTGSIKKVVSDRGFGFIAAEDGKEYFFHRSGVQSSLDFDRLTGGETVEFDVEQSPKGPRAIGVRPAGVAAS